MGNPVVTGSIGGVVSNTETYTDDYSKAFGGNVDYSTENFGAKVQLGEANYANVSVLDGGAIMHAAQLGQAAIDSNSKVLQKVAGSAEAAVSKVLDLMGVREQGDLGTLTRSALWLVGLAVGGLLIWKWLERRGKT